MKDIFEKGIVIRKCKRCGKDIDVTDDENRKLCYSCHVRKGLKTGSTGSKRG